MTRCARCRAMVVPASNPVIGAYGISKAADMQLARNLAGAYGPHDGRVNCIAPGLIRTDFARALWEDGPLLAKRTATTPLRRIGEPDEIAGAAVFLASRAGSLVTGQSLVVDGGMTIELAHGRVPGTQPPRRRSHG